MGPCNVTIYLFRVRIGLLHITYDFMINGTFVHDTLLNTHWEAGRFYIDLLYGYMTLRLENHVIFM